MDAFRLLAWKVKKLRRQLGLTQEEFVEKSGLANARTVSEIENFKGNLTLQKVIDAAYGLGVPISELLSTEGAPEDVLAAPDRAKKAIEALEISTDRVDSL
jgi:transcriptional regulator with XRE-family HTH domain